MLKGSWSHSITGWTGLKLEKRVGRMLLDLAMLGHEVLLEGGLPHPQALIAKHKMGDNLSKEVTTQCKFWKPHVPKKAAAPPLGNSSEGSSSAQHAAAAKVRPTGTRADRCSSTERSEEEGS